MTRTPVSNLNGSILDYFVGRAANVSGMILRDGVPHIKRLPEGEIVYNPSRNWDLAGVLMWNSGITALPVKGEGVWVSGSDPYVVKVRETDEFGQVFFKFTMKGATQLQAAMRSFVAMNLGSHVEIPESLEPYHVAAEA